MTHSVENDRTSWSCPDCPWVQTAHPLYGWSKRDDGAVWVHRNMLCPVVRGGDQ